MKETIKNIFKIHSEGWNDPTDLENPVVGPPEMFDGDKYIEVKYWHIYYYFKPKALADLTVRLAEIIEEMDEEIQRYIDILLPENKACPYCLSTNVIKAGKAKRRSGIHQRYKCKSCNHIFTGEQIE